MSDIAHPKKKKKEKHPKDMTTKEAMEHLFTPEGYKIIKRHIAEVEKKSSTKKG
jgi:hypothetical protein